jgi:hypothetical protein
MALTPEQSLRVTQVRPGQPTDDELRWLGELLPLADGDGDQRLIAGALGTSDTFGLEGVVELRRRYGSKAGA